MLMWHNDTSNDTKYRLDDESRCLCEFRSLRKPVIDDPSVKCKGIYLVSRVI